MLLIKGGRVIDPASGRDEIGHLVLEDGRSASSWGATLPPASRGR